MRRVFIGALVAMLLSVGGAWAGEAEDVKAAEAEAMAWLALVDAGDYAAAWNRAAPMVQAAMKKADFVQAMETSRKPLGSVVERTKTAADYKTSLPGAPDGEYVVILFKTRFAHKADAEENIVPMKDAKGRWRVSGYHFR